MMYLRTLLTYDKIYRKQRKVIIIIISYAVFFMFSGSWLYYHFRKLIVCRKECFTEYHIHWHAKQFGILLI